MNWVVLMQLYESDRAANDALTAAEVASKFNAKTVAASRRMTVLQLIDAIGISDARDFFDDMVTLAATHGAVREVVSFMRAGGDVDISKAAFKAMVNAAATITQEQKDEILALDANQQSPAEAVGIRQTVVESHITKLRTWL